MVLLLVACSTPADTDTAAVDTADTADSAADTADSDPGDTGDTAVVAPFSGLHFSPLVGVQPVEPAWAELAAGAVATGGRLFVDPAEGPGAAENEAWATAIADARYAGAPVLGLVPTYGGTRDAGDVSRDIGRYFAWYDTDGVWFDTDGAKDCASAAPWYLDQAGEADARADDREALVAVRTALDCEALLDDVELVVLHVTGAELAARTRWAWADTAGPERLVVWVEGVPEAELEATLGQAEALGFGHVAVTDRTGDDAWAAPPTYLAAELALLGVAPG